MRVIRVFPRKTRATPDDALAYFGPPDLFAQADEVHIDVTFTADKPRAELLAEDWSNVATVKIGGVAYGDPGQEFIPGRYIKLGYTFTSRGCPERCWYCSVWKRDPVQRLLPIQDGWNVLDDNLLATPQEHFAAVIEMLKRQGRRAEFTGGLQASRLTDFHVNLMASLRPKPVCFFAYDPSPAHPFQAMIDAMSKLLAAGFTRESHRIRTFVLIGYPRDTIAQASQRLEKMVEIGYTPYAMLWQPETPAAMKWTPSPEWRRFQRGWSRPAIIHAKGN
jgi:hypothetical protein